MNAAHHYSINEQVEYREGVTIQRPTKNNEGTWVDVGLPKEVFIKDSILPNIRVTVKIDQFGNQ